MTHPSVDGGTGPLDDAAIVHPFLGPGGAPRSLVLTIDVITPIVDDPRAFGGIAATNALSDVYAMGGRPEVALSFAGFPSDKLPLTVLAEILAGMAEACARARCAIVGGHTIADAEPKAGLSVVGSVDPTRVWSHKTAREGQVLILTKPLGTGIVGQAIRAGKAPEALIAAALKQMLTLNDRACEVGLAVEATSCTDVTGFGLLGHLRNMVEASGLDAELWASTVPILEGTLALIAEGVVPGGSKRNLKHAGQVTSFDEGVSEGTRLLLADAQTSGGLLLCVPEARSEEALRRLADAGIERAAVIGKLLASGGEQRIRVQT
jgi:selenide,water dikinase